MIDRGARPVILLVAVASLAVTAPWATAQTLKSAQPRMQFRVHEIARPGGTNFGQTSAVDVDQDGDLDFISGRQGGDVFWFENSGDGPWRQRPIGRQAKTDVGGVAFDVDGDGDIDILTKPWRGDLHLFVENLNDNKMRVPLPVPK
jgi:hypothetical protein